MLAPVTAAVSRWRRARVFHPDGVSYEASVTMDASTPTEFRDLAKRLSGPALARFSGALWRRGVELPDVLGLALRFTRADRPSVDALADDQDLLLATMRSPLTIGVAAFSTNVHDYARNRFWGACPYDVGLKRAVKFRLSPQHGGVDSHLPRDERLADAVKANESVWRLEIRHTFARRYQPLAIVTLKARARLDDESLRFSPFRSGRGVFPRGYIQAIRRATYASSQLARPNSSAP